MAEVVLEREAELNELQKYPQESLSLHSPPPRPHSAVDGGGGDRKHLAPAAADINSPQNHP